MIIIIALYSIIFGKADRKFSSMIPEILAAVVGASGAVSSWWSPLVVNYQPFLQGLFIVENDSISVKRQVKHCL